MASLEPAPAYEKYVEASGGVGMRVEKPEELEPAMRRAIEIVARERRQVVVNVLAD
jgi:acetolactate synthase-1/2/3 large subunit